MQYHFGRVMLVLAAASIAAAQDQAPITSVHLYKVKPEARRFWNDNIKRNIVPVMKKLMDEGTVVAYGADEDMMHMENAPNADFWYSVPNFAALEKAMKAVQDMLAKMPEAEAAKLMAAHDQNAHSDFLARAMYFKAGKRLESVLPWSRYTMNKVKPGKMGDYRRAWEKYRKPLLDRLVDEGTILSYSLESSILHTSDPGIVWEFVNVTSLDALDKLGAAQREMNQRMSEAERQARTQAYEGVTESAAHRDGLMRAILFAVK